VSPDPETGFVIDLSQLSRIMKERVIDQLDHKNIDLDVPFMKGIYSSTENLAVAIWEQLEAPVNELGGPFVLREGAGDREQPRGIPWRVESSKPPGLRCQRHRAQPASHGEGYERIDQYDQREG
jgi:6-pyruvoyl-tetrahydropterin synthase